MKKELIELIPTLHLVVNAEDINEATSLKQDLKLYGGYARKLLYDYGDKFNVDVSRFNFRKYFPNEIPALQIFYRLFRKRRVLTLGELERAIPYGRLNDEILKKIRENTDKKTPHKKLYFLGQANFTPVQILIYTLAAIALFFLLSFVFLFFQQAFLSE
ncbi:MAG: DUF1493 family protein [Prevotella sp.]|jgi:hypothetical protein|nr:DUF1493 family protein [Prevotella sp.]